MDINEQEKLEKSIAKMKELIAQIKKWDKEYYEFDSPTVPDEVYDKEYAKLLKLESKTGIVMNDSPTNKVSGKAIDKFVKIEHSSPMLSAKKSVEEEDIKTFINGKDFVESFKLDGLTVVLRYNKGKLKQAITRGDGYVGEDVTHNFKLCKNIPASISYKGYLEVRGEALISWEAFEAVNEKYGGSYTHPRNLASGAVRQLDSKNFEDKNVEFFAFTLVNWKDVIGNSAHTYTNSLKWLESQGFSVVPYELNPVKWYKNFNRKKYAYPTDGWIFRYEDLDYGEALGSTGHHPNMMIALKPALETEESKFRGIDYKVSRTGLISLTAFFDPVILDGTTVERASVHNVDIVEEFAFGIGDRITVGKANMIIPQIFENLDKSGTYKFIETCPCCGNKVEIKKVVNTRNLYCTNENCPAKLLAKFTHFVSRSCMNIDGLSEATLEKLIDAGIVKNFGDIYKLGKRSEVIPKLESFGEKSAKNLLKSIEKSRGVKLENLLPSFGIPNIGKTASRAISKQFNGNWNKFITALENNYDFTQLEDFGSVADKNLKDWYKDYKSGNTLIGDLLDEIVIFEEARKTEVSNEFIKGKVFAITGALSHPRKEYEEFIVKNEGKLSGSVGPRTHYLITNESSGSSKYQEAIKRNIPIITEEEFLSKVGGHLS